MYEHPKLTAFTGALAELFHEVDGELEDCFGGSFPLHPRRPGRGAAANPEMDGLFEIAPDFTLGIGSEQGRGYLVGFRVATLERVPPERFETLMTEAAERIAAKLPAYFPGRSLRVVRDGKRFKIVGDFSLGDA